MRLAVMSDVHGNLPALEAVLSDLKQHETDGVIQSCSRRTRRAGEAGAVIRTTCYAASQHN